MRLFLIALLLAIGNSFANAQDSIGLYDKIYSFPDKFFSSVEKRTQKLEAKMQRSAVKYLRSLEKKERRIIKKMHDKDFSASGEIENAAVLYNRLQNHPDSIASLEQRREYLRGLDSVKTTLAFLMQKPGVNTSQSQLLNKALDNYKGIQNKMNQMSSIERLLTQRKEFLKERLSDLQYKKLFDQYQQQIYYFREKMNSYRKLLNEPQKLEAEIIRRVSELPAFKKFFNRYSELAGLFRLPQDDLQNATLSASLQTRAMLASQFQERFGSGAQSQQYVSNNLINAQSALNELKGKLTQLGPSGGDMNMPGFKPNNQKTKTFKERLEYGVNIQSVKSQMFLPSRSDIGLSIGYKLKDNWIAGIGVSYKIGWGNDIRHISISHQGVSARSFIDIKLKKSFWLTGGFEMNYLSQFHSFDELKDYSAWQRSGLIGISKKISLKNKFLKSTKIQLLWDFLSYQQTPQPQPIIYRLAYDF